MPSTTMVIIPIRSTYNVAAVVICSVSRHIDFKSIACLHADLWLSLNTLTCYLYEVVAMLTKDHHKCESIM